MEDHYQLILHQLFRELQSAKNKNGKRALRKLVYKLKLYNTYYKLLQECEPVLSPYYQHPVYLVNRFWSGLDPVEMISKEQYPSLLDFFAWFCSSDTIAREREEQW